MRRFEIASTWDGRPLPPAERYAIELGPGGEALAVRVDAPYHGDPPPAGPPGPTDRLWEHEVVELFVAGAGARYLEVEMGPHGHYLVLELEGRRNVVRRGHSLRFAPRLDGGRWKADLDLPWSYLPPRPSALNLYAIHGAGGMRRHLALAPTFGRAPDFHRLERFLAVDVASL